jgi:tRNA uridine 5-carboxymethylaminomethyl modification enzyme
LKKERNNADKLLSSEDVKIPENFDYEKNQIYATSKKNYLKLDQLLFHKHQELVESHSSDVSVLLIYMGR